MASLVKFLKKVSPFCEGLYETRFSNPAEPQLIVEWFAALELSSIAPLQSELDFSWQSFSMDDPRHILFDFPETGYRLHVRPGFETEFHWDMTQAANRFDLNFGSAKILGYLHIADGKRFFPVVQLDDQKPNVELVVSWPSDASSIHASLGKREMYNGRERCHVQGQHVSLFDGKRVKIYVPYPISNFDCARFRIDTNVDQNSAPKYAFRSIYFGR